MKTEKALTSAIFSKEKKGEKPWRKFSRSAEFRGRISAMVKPRKCSRSNRSGVNDSGKSKKFSVYEFNPDDELVEKDSHKLASKFKPKIPRISSSPLDKYNFLRYFTKGGKTSENNIERETLEIEDSDDDVAESVCGVVRPVSSQRRGDCESSCANLPTDHLNSMCSSPGGRSRAPENINLRGRGSGQSPVDNDINFCPESGHNCVIDLESSSESDLGRHEASSQEASERCSRSPFCEAVVIIHPDLVIFGDMYSTSAFLIFSRKSIKLEGSDCCGTKVFSVVWSISDAVRIKSFWCRKVETAFISLQLKSANEEAAKTINNVSELYFAVYDPCWCERQEAIESLGTRYKAIWNTVLKIDPLWSEFSPLQKKSGTAPEVCSPNCYTTFENFVYPHGEPDAVTLSTKDIELLRPASFINDTIVDFYVKYLEQHIEPEEKHRFHFFNSFFFRKLADLDKDPSTACDGRSAFHRVFRWTRKVNIFEKDYIFIPVNFSLHWSLVIICHPGEVAKFTEEEMSDSPKVPCILHMDSIRGSHRGLNKLFQRYLCEEWKERHNESSEHISSKFLSLLFVTPELPQQGNSYDCGLFLLYYLERFLQQAPVNFSPFTTFLRKDWFAPVEASSRRDHIKNLIYKIARCNTHKDPSTTDDCCSSCYTIEGDPGQGFGWDTSTGIGACGSNYSAQNKNEEIQMTSPLRLPMRHLGSCRESYQGAGALGSADGSKSLKDKTCLQHGQAVPVNQLFNVMSPIEEEEATAVAPATVKPSSSIADASAAILIPEFKDVESSSDSSIGVCPIISLEVHDKENCAPRASQVSVSDETSKNDSCARSSDDLDVYVVEDSLERNDSTDIKELRTTPLHGGKSNSMYEEDVESPYTKVNVVDSMEEERMMAKPKSLINRKGTLARYLSKDLRL